MTFGADSIAPPTAPLVDAHQRGYRHLQKEDEVGDTPCTSSDHKMDGFVIEVSYATDSESSVTKLGEATLKLRSVIRNS